MSGPGSAGAALLAGRRRLEAAGVPDPGTDARRLLAHALGMAPDRLVLALPEPLPPEAAVRLEAALERRAAREPVSHILGLRAFWGRDFAVSPDVLDPRPETEALVACALARPFGRVLDLGTGSGCILLSLLAERPGATGLGVDCSAAALAVAQANAARLGVGRAEFALSDWFSAVAGRFDLIVANPPYIAAAEMAGLAPELRLYEPRGALTDEGDGLSAYRAIAAGLGAHLAPGGRFLAEFGAGQGPEVAQILERAGLGRVALHPDLDGRPRFAEARAG